MIKRRSYQKTCSQTRILGEPSTAVRRWKWTVAGGWRASRNRPVKYHSKPSDETRPLPFAVPLVNTATVCVPSVLERPPQVTVGRVRSGNAKREKEIDCTLLKYNVASKDIDNRTRPTIMVVKQPTRMSGKASRSMVCDNLRSEPEPNSGGNLRPRIV